MVVKKRGVEDMEAGGRGEQYIHINQISKVEKAMTAAICLKGI